MDETFQKPELLAPAGGFDQLRYAIYFGADAVYLAADRFGLRQRATNFALDQIPAAVAYAHQHGVQVHLTCNALMDAHDLEALPPYLEALAAAGVDALIISDLGALRLAKKYAPGVALHVSTQASCSNAQAAHAWYDMGARRIVCAREMSLDDIATMRRDIPADLELEVFVQGAMCMAVSGRCLISDYLTGRSGNKGHCTQPCRWSYTLEEEKRPGEHFPVEEDERGTYIMNSKDMNMLAHLDDLRAAGVNSLKIEGRNKKAFYVATVVNAYRQVLDGADPALFASELETISHRPYSTGFFYGYAQQAPEESGYIQGYLLAATVTACEPLGADAADAAGEQQWLVRAECYNRFCEGDVLEVLSPHCPVARVRVRGLQLLHSGGSVEAVAVANRSQSIYGFISPIPLTAHAILRIESKG
ncbi:MAG: U32 family peptidase [Raoultibacter sp.]